MPRRPELTGLTARRARLAVTMALGAALLGACGAPEDTAGPERADAPPSAWFAPITLIKLLLGHLLPEEERQ